MNLIHTMNHVSQSSPYILFSLSYSPLQLCLDRIALSIILVFSLIPTLNIVFVLPGNFRGKYYPHLVNEKIHSQNDLPTVAKLVSGRAKS